MVWGGAGEASYPGNRTELKAEVTGHLPSILPLFVLANRDCIPQAPAAHKERPHFSLLAAGSTTCSVSDATGWDCLQSSRTVGMRR